MDKLRFLDQCSTEALLEVFDPRFEAQLNTQLSEVVLRQILSELIRRDVIQFHLDDHFTSGMERAFIGQSFCKDCLADLGFEGDGRSA